MFIYENGQYIKVTYSIFPSILLITFSLNRHRYLAQYLFLAHCSELSHHVQQIFFWKLSRNVIEQLLSTFALAGFVGDFDLRNVSMQCCTFVKYFGFKKSDWVPQAYASAPSVCWFIECWHWPQYNGPLLAIVLFTIEWNSRSHKFLYHYEYLISAGWNSWLCVNYWWDLKS